MGEVVQLFKKMTCEDAKSAIITNLKEMHQGKWVNLYCAIRDIDDWGLAEAALRALIAENIVQIQENYVEDDLKRGSTVALYRYNTLRDSSLDH
jgi:hypothetical protein